jgi:hypothetical protein
MRSNQDSHTARTNNLDIPGIAFTNVITHLGLVKSNITVQKIGNCFWRFLKHSIINQKFDALSRKQRQACEFWQKLKKKVKPIWALS